MYTNLLVGLLWLVSVTGFAQVEKSPKPAPAGSFNLGRRADGYWSERGSNGAETPIKVEPNVNHIPTFQTLTDVRAFTLSSGMSPKVITITDAGTGGVFVLDASDKTSTDNTGAVIVTSSNLRYKRLTDTFTVKMFGAKGDGTTADLEAIQRAINYTVPNHKRLIFTDGTYILSDKLVINAKNTTGWQIVGEGTVVLHQNGVNKPIFYFNDEHAVNWTIDNFTYEWATKNNIAKNTNQVAIALSDNPSTNLYGWYNFRVLNSRLTNGWGLIKLMEDQMTHPHGFWACLFDDTLVGDDVLGIAIDNHSTYGFGSPRINISRFYSFGQRATTHRIRLEAADNCLLTDIEFNRIHSNHGIYMQSCFNMKIDGIRAETVDIDTQYSALFYLENGIYDVRNIVLANVVVKVPNIAYIFRFGGATEGYTSRVSNLTYRRYRGDSTVYTSGRLCALYTDAKNPVLYDNVQTQAVTSADAYALFYYYDDVSAGGPQGGAPYISARSQDYQFKLASVSASATANLTSEGISEVRIFEPGFIRSLQVFLGATKTSGTLTIRVYKNSKLYVSYAIANSVDFGHYFRVPFYNPDDKVAHQVARGDKIRIEVVSSSLAPTAGQSVQAILKIVE